MHWTPELIQEKYGTYVHGYKIEGDIKKQIFPYIITVEGQKIVYIQFHNAYDFPRDPALKDYRTPLLPWIFLLVRGSIPTKD